MLNDKQLRMEKRGYNSAGFRVLASVPHATQKGPWGGRHSTSSKICDGWNKG